jgi:phage-related minor tail protein
MDTQSLRSVIKEVLSNYEKLRPSHGDIRLDVVFDEEHDRYALMQTGWSGGKRVRGNLIYLTIASNQILIEYDGMEKGITDDLLEQGVPSTQIVHAFLAEQREAMAL